MRVAPWSGASGGSRRAYPTTTRVKGRMRLFALLLMLALVAAACGGDSGGDVEEPAAGDSEAAAGGSESADAGGGELSCEEGDISGELLVWGSRDYYVPPDQFEGLTEKYPDLTINLDIQSNDDILQQLQRMKDAGQKMPDIIHDDTFLVEQYKAAGVITPIDDLMAAWEAGESEQYEAILPITWEENQYEDETYGMAIMANYDIVYYNSSWFEEAGVEPPFETFSDLYDAMVKMKESRPDSIPLTVQALAGEGVTTFKTVGSAMGVPFEGAVPELTSEAGLELIEFFQNAQKDELLPPEAISWGESEARAAFIRGDAGLIMDGITVAADFNEVGDFTYPEDWQTTVLPVKTDVSEGERITSARTWMVTPDAENRCAALAVLQYIADKDVLLDTLEGGAVPMRNTEAIDDPRMQEILPLFTEELKETYLEAGTVPAGINSGEVEQVLEQLWGEIVTGTDATPQELADKYQPQLDEL